MNKIKDNFGLIAALVAVITFVFSVINNYTIEKEVEIRTWQKTVVFDIVIQSEKDPISFNDIQQKYVTESQTFKEYDIPKNELSEASTKRILLELIRDGALVLKNKDSYSVAIQQYDLIEENIEMARKVRQRFGLQETLYSILATDSGKHTPTHLVKLLSKEAKVSFPEASVAVSQAIAQRLFYIDPNTSKTSLLIDAPSSFLTPMVPPINPPKVSRSDRSPR